MWPRHAWTAIEMNNLALGGRVQLRLPGPDRAKRVEIMNGPQSSIWGSERPRGLMYIDTTPCREWCD